LKCTLKSFSLESFLKITIVDPTIKKIYFLKNNQFDKEYNISELIINNKENKEENFEKNLYLRKDNSNIPNERKIMEEYPIGKKFYYNNNQESFKDKNKYKKRKELDNIETKCCNIY